MVLSISITTGRVIRKPVWLDGGTQTAVRRDKEEKTAKMGHTVVCSHIGGSVKLQRR